MTFSFESFKSTKFSIRVFFSIAADDGDRFNWNEQQSMAYFIFSHLLQFQTDWLIHKAMSFDIFFFIIILTETRAVYHATRRSFIALGMLPWYEDFYKSWNTIVANNNSDIPWKAAIAIRYLQLQWQVDWQWVHRPSPKLQVRPKILIVRSFDLQLEVLWIVKIENISVRMARLND